jgi:membrane-associated protease RseP (regulator of RpoE activity)
MNLILFLATVVSVFVVGASYVQTDATSPDPLRALPGGWRFAVPLLSILLVHEFGHYFAARAHGVRASLPYFIPLPFVGLGTLGAVISMKERIKSRNALLDIGASGPLAGLVVAIPVLVIGLMQSPVQPLTDSGLQEGQSLLYIALKRLILGPIPEGHDVFLGPVAYAGWAGLLVTMINLLPVGQLDGGHVAYALFGPRQNRLSRIVHHGVLVLFAVNLARFLPPAIREGTGDALTQALMNSTFWLLWYGIVHLLRRIGGADHPPTEPGELSPGRKVIAVFTLALYALLLMPTPMSVY